MPKTIRNQFDKCLTFEKLLEAHQRAKKGKACKKEVILFEMDLETNLMNLYNKLKKGTYQIGRYYEFKIYEPKERVIQALPYVDRIVHQWYVHEFIKPYFLPRFISDSYACIDERGTHLAVSKLQGYMRKMPKDYYILKGDIKKFFYSIDKDSLFNLLKKFIKDKKILNLTRIFIFDSTNKKGIPIGNYTSQYYANIYLNEIDKFVKQVLKVKYYVRYMDDFVLLLKNKEEAKYNCNRIKSFLEETLRLECNQKTNYYPSSKGINFCGYIIHKNYILVRKRCIKKIKRKVRKWNKLALSGNLDEHKFLLCFNSFKGHIGHANSYNLYRKIVNSLIF